MVMVITIITIIMIIMVIIMIKDTCAEKSMMGMLAKRRRQSTPIIRLIDVGHVCHDDDDDDNDVDADEEEEEDKLCLNPVIK